MLYQYKMYNWYISSHTQITCMGHMGCIARVKVLHDQAMTAL